MTGASAPVSRRDMIQLIDDNIRTLERILNIDPTPHPDNLRMLEVYRVIALVLCYAEIPEYPSHVQG